MTTMISKDDGITIYPSSDLGFDETTYRYYVALYLCHFKKEYIVYVSCDDYNPDTFEATNMTIEFLTYEDSNNTEVPYDAYLFEELEIVACEMFKDIKEERVTVG